MIIKQINGSRIRKVNQYKYHFNSVDQFLIESIKEHGVLFPLWLVKANGYIIIDGHRRYLAAVLNNLEKIPAIVFPKEKLNDAFLEALHINFLKGDLSLIEKFKACEIAEAHLSKDVVEKVMTLFKFKQIAGIKKMMKMVKYIPLWFQEYLHTNNFQLKILRKMMQFPFNKYQNWFIIAVRLKINGSNLISILDKVYDILSRDQIEMEELWNHLQIDRVLEKKGTEQQKLLRIKINLEAIRYPILHEINHIMHQYKLKIERELGEDFTISWDNSLEQPGVVLKIILSDVNIFEEYSKKLQDEKLKGQFRKLLSTTEKIATLSS